MFGRDTCCEQCQQVKLWKSFTLNENICTDMYATLIVVIYFTVMPFIYTYTIRYQIRFVHWFAIGLIGKDQSSFGKPVQNSFYAGGHHRYMIYHKNLRFSVGTRVIRKRFAQCLYLQYNTHLFSRYT